MPTYYDLFKLPENASAEDIKTAYRALLKQSHPDLAQDKAAANALTQELNAAYAILSDADKRAIYDATLHPKHDWAVTIREQADSQLPSRQFAPMGLDFSLKGWLARLIIGFLILYLCAALVLMLGQMI